MPVADDHVVPGPGQLGVHRAVQVQMGIRQEDCRVREQESTRDTQESVAGDPATAVVQQSHQATRPRCLSQRQSR